MNAHRHACIQTRKHQLQYLKMVCVTLHYITLHYITSHCMTLHDITNYNVTNYKLLSIRFINGKPICLFVAPSGSPFFTGNGSLNGHHQIQKFWGVVLFNQKQPGWRFQTKYGIIMMVDMVLIWLDMALIWLSRGKNTDWIYSGWWLGLPL